MTDKVDLDLRYKGVRYANDYLGYFTLVITLFKKNKIKKSSCRNAYITLSKDIWEEHMEVQKQ